MKNKETRIIQVLCFVLVSVLIVYGVTYIKDSVLYENTVVPYQEKFDDEEIDEMVNSIKERYGIEIVYNIPNELIDASMSKNEEYCDLPHQLTSMILIEYIDEFLQMYTDEAISQMPKKWFLINSTETHDGSIIPGRILQLGDNDVMILTTSQYLLKVYDYQYAERVMHHELFHSIFYEQLSPLQLLKFASINESCSKITEYACTNIMEETADA